MSQGKTKMIPQQISALENMHYCYFVRLEHLTDARIVESKIKRLKQLQELQKSCSLEEYDRCSETDNEAEDVDVASEEDMKAGNTDGKSSLMRHSDYPIKVNLEEECSEDDDLPLSTLRPQKPLSTNIPNGTGKRNRGNIKKQDTTGVAYISQSKKQTSQNENLETQYSSQSKTLRKRPRIVLSDEEGNHDIVDINGEVTGSETQPHQTAGCSKDSESKRVISKKEEELIIFCKDVFQEQILQTEPASSTIDLKMTEAPKEDTCELSMNQVEQQQERSPVGVTCGSHSKQFFQHNAKPDHSAQHEAMASQNIGPPVYWNNSKVPETISVNMVGQIMKVDLRNLTQDNAQLKSIDSLKQEVVRIYSCNNPAGMKPLLRHLVLKGTILQAAELVEDVLSALSPEDRLEAIVDGWIPMPLIERYQVFCQLHHEKCNLNLVNQLKNCQATEDKVAASGCNLDDRSAWPLLMALTENGTFTHLDFSHNSLGIYSIQKIQQMIAIGNQVDLGLTLDFHHNNLGAASLGHICNCPIILSRLEVLNLSSNRLTDAAARHLATLVKNCRALEVLKLEGCDLTTRTILKIASALQADSPLIKLALGKNNPISSLAIAGLLDKLSSLESFSELDLTGVNLDKPGVERICLLLNASLSMSSLMLGETGIQSDGALVLSNAICSKPEMLVKLDISFCAISLDVSDKLCSEIRLLRCLTHLNLSGNKLSEKGVVELALVLLGSGCRLRALLLKRCRVGRSGMLILLKALQGNNILQLLDLEGNCTSGTVPFSFTTMNCTPDGMLASDRTVRTEQLEPVTPKHPKTSLKLKGELSRPTSGCSNELNRGDHATGAAYAASDTQKKRNDLCGSEDKPHDILPKEEPNPADNEVRAISSSEICTEVCPKYDVADSEDEGGNGITTTRRNHMDEDCASSSQKLEMVDNESGADRQETNTVWVTSTSLMGQPVHCNTGELVDELATALSMAQGLQYLSLSENELSSESVQRLYMAWSCSSRCASMPSKHVDGKVIHFTSDNKDCCSIKPCCEPG